MDHVWASRNVLDILRTNHLRKDCCHLFLEYMVGFFGVKKDTCSSKGVSSPQVFFSVLPPSSLDKIDLASASAVRREAELRLSGNVAMSITFDLGIPFYICPSSPAPPPA